MSIHTGPQAAHNAVPSVLDERRLAGAVREHVNGRKGIPAGMRRLDLDRTDVAVVLWAAGMNREDIAAVIGVQPARPRRPEPRRRPQTRHGRPRRRQPARHPRRPGRPARAGQQPAVGLLRRRAARGTRLVNRRGDPVMNLRTAAAASVYVALVPVGFGLAASAGVFAAGATLTVRDTLRTQEARCSTS